MPRTKNALVRQRVIDRCLGSPKTTQLKALWKPAIESWKVLEKIQLQL